MGNEDIRMGNILSRWAMNYPDGKKIFTMGAKILGWEISYPDGK